MIHRHRGNRRFRDYVKAKRKADLVKLGGFWHYRCFHQLYKGKIHCSCPMCAQKTNTRLSRSRGPVCFTDHFYPDGTSHRWVRGSRIPMTNHRYGKKDYKASDKRKIDEMRGQMVDYGKF